MFKNPFKTHSKNHQQPVDNPANLNESLATGSFSSKVGQGKVRQSKLRQTLVSLVQYLLIFVAIYLIMNWWRQPSMPEEVSFHFTDYQNQPVALSDMSQQSPVLVYFWGSWCGACSVSSPKVNELANSGYPVVSIAVKSGDNQELASYMLSKDYQFTTINDEDGSIFKNWQATVTPSYVILNKGQMVQGMTGVQPVWLLKLRLSISRYFN